MAGQGRPGGTLAVSVDLKGINPQDIQDCASLKKAQVSGGFLQTAQTCVNAGVRICESTTGYTFTLCV